MLSYIYHNEVQKKREGEKERQKKYTHNTTLQNNFL